MLQPSRQSSYQNLLCFFLILSEFESFSFFSCLLSSLSLSFPSIPISPNHASLSADFNKAIAIHAYEPLYSSGGSRKKRLCWVFSFLLDIFRVLMLPFACLVQRTKEWVRARWWRRSRKNIPSHSVIHGTAEEELTALCHRRKYIYSSYFPTLSADDLAAERSAREAKWYSASREVSCLSGRTFYLWEDDDNDISYNYDVFLIIFYTF